MLSEAPKRLAKDALNEGAGTKAETAEEKVDCAEGAEATASALGAEVAGPTSTIGGAGAEASTEAAGAAGPGGRADKGPPIAVFSSTSGAVDRRAA